VSRRSWARNGSDGRARLLRDHLDLLVDGAVAGLHAPEGPSAALPGIVGEVFWCAALCGEDGSLLWMLTDVVDACVGAANRGAASGGGPGHAAGTLRVFRTIIRSIGGPRKVTEEGGAGKRDGGDHLAYGKPWIAMLSEELSNGVTRHDAADDEDDDPCDPEEYFIDHYKKRRDDDDADDADEPAEKPAGDDRRKTSQCIWWRWTRWTRAAPSSPRGGADVRRRPAPRGLPPPRRAAAALQRRRAVDVGVDPEGARRVVGRQLDHVRVLRLGADRQRRVVGRQRARAVQPVEVQVRDVRPLGAVGVAREAEPVAEAYSQRVPRTHVLRLCTGPT